MSNEIMTPNESTLILNQAQLEIFTQTTPKDEIRVRQGRGGKNLLYTDSAYVIRTLNKAFAWNWDFISDQAEILYVGDRPFEVKCRGLLTVRIGDQAITKTQYGCQPIEMLKDGSAPVSLGGAFKGAATDALKKCASLLGIALDLYDSDSETVTGKAKPQPQQRQAPVVVERPKSTQPPKTSLDNIINPEFERLMDTPLSLPTSPQALTDAVNATLGEKYYDAPNHVYNALGKVPWPKPDDKQSWADVYTAALDHARQRRAEKAALAGGEAK